MINLKKSLPLRSVGPPQRLRLRLLLRRWRSRSRPWEIWRIKLPLVVCLALLHIVDSWSSSVHLNHTLLSYLHSVATLNESQWHLIKNCMQMRLYSYECLLRVWGPSTYRPTWYCYKYVLVILLPLLVLKLGFCVSYKSHECHFKTC